MNRRSLIKSILALAAAPKILAEIDFKPPIIAKYGPTKSLVSDLQLLTPKYYRAMCEKYGTTDFAGMIATNLNTIKNDPNYFWFESRNKIDNNGN